MKMCNRNLDSYPLVPQMAALLTTWFAWTPRWQARGIRSMTWPWPRSGRSSQWWQKLKKTGLAWWPQQIRISRELFLNSTRSLGRLIFTLISRRLLPPLSLRWSLAWSVTPASPSKRRKARSPLPSTTRNRQTSPYVSPQWKNYLTRWIVSCTGKTLAPWKSGLWPTSSSTSPLRVSGAHLSLLRSSSPNLGIETLAVAYLTGRQRG